MSLLVSLNEILAIVREEETLCRAEAGMEPAFGAAMLKRLEERLRKFWACREAGTEISDDTTRQDAD